MFSTVIGWPSWFRVKMQRCAKRAFCDQVSNVHIAACSECLRLYFVTWRGVNCAPSRAWSTRGHCHQFYNNTSSPFSGQGDSTGQGNLIPGDHPANAFFIWRLLHFDLDWPYQEQRSLSVKAFGVVLCNSKPLYRCPLWQNTITYHKASHKIPINEPRSF